MLFFPSFPWFCSNFRVNVITAELTMQWPHQSQWQTSKEFQGRLRFSSFPSFLCIKGNRKTAEPISISARKEIFKKKCIHHAQKNVVVCPSYFFTPCFPWALSPSTRMGPCKKETHWACGNLTITRKVAVPASIFPICYPGERAFMVRGHQRRALQGGEKKSLQNRLLQLSSFPFSSPPFFCCIPNHKLSHLVTWAFVPRDMTFEDLKEVKRRWSREMMWG